jgi:hypothetical protein
MFNLEIITLKRRTRQALKIAFLFILITPSVFAAEKKSNFDTSNDFLMNATILGAISSLGFACYQGKAPCSLSPGINTDKLTFSVDVGEDNTIKQTRIALGADWIENIYRSKNLTVNGRMELNTNLWNSTLKTANNKSGYIIGIAPVFRYISPKITRGGYFELGGGPQYLSSSIIENENKSTQFQFGSILGFGFTGKTFEAGYRYLHISNANIEIPNPGTDFHSLHLAYKF